MIAYLQQRRKFLVIVLAITVFAFVGAGFVGWGSYSYGSRSGAVATVGEEKVSFLQFSQAYNNLYNMYSQFYENGLDPQMENQLKQAALEGLIDKALLINFAKDLELRISDEELQTRIISIDAFKKDGVFNKEIYKETIRNARSEIKDFEKEMADQLLIEKLFGFMGTPVTDNEKEMMAASILMEDRVAIEVINAPKTVTITNAEAQKFFEANAQNYMGEPTYDVSYIKVGIAGYTATEEEASDYYSKNRGEFLTEDGELLSFDSAKDLAIKAAKMNKARRDALKQKIEWRDGKVEPKSVKGVAFSNKTIPFEVISELENAQNKRISDPIAVEDGYMVAKIDSRYEAKPMSFDEAKAFIERDLKRQKTNSTLEATAQKELSTFKGKDVGFVSRGDAAKLTMLNEEDASVVLDQIFSTIGEDRGVVYLDNKAVLYRVIDQKLFDPAKLKDATMMLDESVARVKFSQIQQDLIERLRTQYKITVY